MNTVVQSWFVLRSGPGEPAFNMAMDAALLENIAILGQPVLRFYSWTEKAASFGYFQKHAELEALTKLRPLIRRPTGGGLVPHDSDWTYSVAIPPSDAWYSLNAVASYERMHEWVRAAFSSLGIEAGLASAARKELPGQCFAGYEKSDVLWEGVKIAGAAQRRARAGLLIQGSVQPPPIELDRIKWERAMCNVAESHFGISWMDFVPSTTLMERAVEMANKTFSQDSYNRRR